MASFRTSLRCARPAGNRAARRIVVPFVTLAFLAVAGCEASTDASLILSTVGEFLGLEREAASSADPQAQAGDSRSTTAVIIETSDVSVLQEPGGVSDAKAYFSYEDDDGGAHIVQGLHNVPAARQKSARNLTRNGSRPINRYDGALAAQRRQPRLLDTSADFNPNRLNVTIFSAEWCGACKRARQLLDSEGVDYELRDIDHDSDARDEVRQILGGVQIPLLDINGTYVAGYDRKTITRLIRGG